MSDPKVMIGVPTVGAIDPRFYSCSMELVRPNGTMVAVPPRAVTDVARNAICRAAIDRGFSHVLFIDDDMTFPPNLLVRLLTLSIEHPEFDAIAALAFARHAPHHPMIYRRKEPGSPLFSTVKEFGKGLVEVDGMATAGFLLRIESLKRIEYPWFEYLYINGQRYTEDLSFCLKMKDAGARFACDTDLEMGHLADRREIRRGDFEQAAGSA
ncbi:MAG: hypothetical protein ACRD1Z_06615, partial [Vicinamibacteria bacterium]